MSDFGIAVIVILAAMAVLAAGMAWDAFRERRWRK